MTSFIDRLFRFRAGEGRDQQEDFLTEVFSGVLKLCPELATDFTAHLIGRNSTLTALDISTLKTQKSFPGGRLDMWIEASCTGNRHVVAVENKIASSEGPCQLRRYENYLAEQDAVSKTLVYITRASGTNFSGGQKGVCFVSLTWNDVYDWIKDWMRNCAPDGCCGRLLIEQLLALMVDWKMTISLTASDLSGATTCWASTHETLWHILDLAWGDSKLSDVADGLRWKNKMQTNLYYESLPIPNVGVCLYYGFDFDRTDERWNVRELLIPSAYVALYLGEDQTLQGQIDLSDDWKSPEQGEWNSYTHVRQLSELVQLSPSLGHVYLRFFTESLNELVCLFDRT